MSFLILGLVLFLGVHSVRILAGDWREAQIARLGEMRWKGAYSLASAAGLGLIVWGYGMAHVDSPVLWQTPPWTRHVAATLTVPAFILLVAAYIPGSHIKAAVGHPMVAGVTVWAVAHLIANGSLADATLFGVFLVWAVVSFASSHRRDRLAGRGYPARGWSADGAVLAVGLVAWAAFAFYGHAWLIGVRPFGA